MEIRKGTINDISQIDNVYNELTDYLECHINYPGWKKGVYPTYEDAKQGIDEDSLFVAIEDGIVVGSFILRHKPEEAYKLADWHVDIDYSNIYVIYTLAVHPKYMHCGIGLMIMEFIEQYSKEQNQKAIRLDVYEKNTPAIQLYEKMGFEQIDKVDLGYSQYGLDYFYLYQKLLV